MPYKSSFEKLCPDQRQRRSSLAEWLEKLQQESWQLELLISGFAILGCLEASKVVEKKMVLLLVNPTDEFVVYGFLAGMGLMVLTVGLTVFIINLIVHVITRALWIGAIGLRYVSGEIDHDQLPYNDRFKAYFRDRVGDFDEYIDKIERFSSTIFSYTFLLVFVLFAFFVFLTIPLVLALMAITGYEAYSIGFAVGQGGGLVLFLVILTFIILFVYLLLGLVVGIDFLTLGLLKRVKKGWFVRAYLPIYRFYSFITLSFIWRPLLLNFLDEKFTRRMFRFTFPYVLVVILLPEISSEPYGYHPTIRQIELGLGSSGVAAHYYWFEFYDDLVDDEKWGEEASVIKNFSIPSKRLSGPIFEVFVKYTEEDEKAIQYKEGAKPFNDIGMTFLGNMIGTTLSVLQDTGYTRQLDSTLTRYKELIKVEGDPRRKAELTAEKEVKINSLQHRFREWKEQPLVNVKDLLLENLRVLIDDRLVSNSKIDADFYTHPRHGERGMLCFFTLDSLAVGRHTFSLERRTENTRDLLHNTTTIPFMYEGR